jgi:hypothetical protein
MSAFTEDRGNVPSVTVCSANATILTVKIMLLAFEMNYVEAAWTFVP